jgi:cyclopropane fatty-acyl-phospholipid synthase-like methyltransferase
MVTLHKQPSVRPRRRIIGTVVRCYSLFDKFFPACGLLDYTEGIYPRPDTSYEEAQQNQINYVLDEVLCGPGTRILEIGCGNGNLLAEVSRRRAQGVGLTISPEQVALCCRRGLDVRLLDYRDLDEEFSGQFDAVVANGPVEHFVQPRDAEQGLADAIYREFFEICHRAIDPLSLNQRLINTTIHFVRTPDPQNLLRSPWTFRWGSDNFHWAMLARSFGGWYPVKGQLERTADGLFRRQRIMDGTHDYHLTSEEWLRRIKCLLWTWRGMKIVGSSLSFALRHPGQYFNMLTCMLASQSWNWQFRGNNPPTRLLRETWEYQPAI